MSDAPELTTASILPGQHIDPPAVTEAASESVDGPSTEPDTQPADDSVAEPDTSEETEVPAAAVPDPMAIRLAEVEAEIQSLGNPHAEYLMAEARRAAVANLRRHLIAYLELIAGSIQTSVARSLNLRQEVLVQRETLYRRRTWLRQQLGLPCEDPAPDAATSVTQDMVVSEAAMMAALMGIDVSAMLRLSAQYRATDRRVPVTAAELNGHLQRVAADLGYEFSAVDREGGVQVTVKQVAAIASVAY